MTRDTSHDNRPSMVYRYLGFHGSESHCRLDFYTGPGGENIVVATELPDNSGTSITNMAEELAALVCCDFNIAPASLLWIEHYPDRREHPDDISGAESWDLVTFDICGFRITNPQWRRMSEAELHLLTDGALPSVTKGNKDQ